MTISNRTRKSIDILMILKRTPGNQLIYRESIDIVMMMNETPGNTLDIDDIE